MKTFILVLAALSTSLSFAGTKRLICTTGNTYESFRAVLDDGTYEPGSGYFNVKDAAITDNYATADLNCVGHTLPEIVCVGFWFRTSGEIVEVSTAKTGEAVTSSYRPLVGSYHLNDGPWKCTTEAIAPPKRPTRF